jgi:hypothetical protein
MTYSGDSGNFFESKNSIKNMPPKVQSDGFPEQFYALVARFDRLEQKLEILISKVIDEVNNGNKPKDLPLDKFFSRFCALKGLDEDHPTASAYRTGFNRFFKFCFVV